MTLGQLYGVFVLVLAALPLGAIGLMAAVYGAHAVGRLPDSLVDAVERHLLLPYCGTMAAILLLATILVGGWTERILFAIVAGTFFAAIHNFLPRFRTLKDDGGAAEPPDDGSRLRLSMSASRQVIAIVSAAQWLIVLIVYVRLIS